MAENKDPYNVLGVTKDSSPEEIKKAYRKLSKQYHPDINKDAGAEDKFKEITEAYETVGDPQKKAEYDQYGSAGSQGGAYRGFGGQGQQGGFGGGGFEDIFSSFFGGGGASQDPTAPRAGRDLQYEMTLTFNEGVFGKESTIKYNRKSLCATCSGSGAKPGTSPITCHKCGGRGTIQVERRTPLGNMMTEQECDVCHGTGKEIKEKCDTCHGSGHIDERHEVKVTVPAGVEDGQQMRLQGQGESGENSGPYGDLYIIFRVQASGTFDREGPDIYIDVPISFVQAALGDEVTVPTVHGDVKMKIPAGTQTGTTFRLRDKGAPKLHGKGNGDQEVTVNIETPRNLKKEQKDALKEFATASGKNVVGEGNLFDKLKDQFKNKK
ncbi:molecular chaperone DnaJ [Dellaglioa sp. P0083]|uniref:molecular chaperone DnaJ n=1 Tax=Dellaglioa kimchii TaxID=3344667 RepID=UPI0038D42A07